MGKLSACFAIASLVFIGACGSDHATPDASIKIIDAMPDSPKVWEDAPPGPDYDLTCFGATAPTTAADPITLAGTTQTFGQNGGSSVPMVAVDVFKNSSNTPVASVVSDATGAFTTGNIATGGVPMDGYIRLAKSTYRTSYTYPPSPIVASLTDVPALLLSNSTFDQLAGVGGGQDDTLNGALFFAVTDCNLATQTLIPEATVKVQQNGADVGTILDIGQFIPQADGTYVVLNVPDGATQILVSFNGMMFPTRTVGAFKKPAGQNQEGTLTATAIRPGP